MRLLVAFMLVASVLAAVGLSGCVSCADGPPVSARDITSGPASDGDGGWELAIQVTDGPDGPPLPGAGVAVYWGDARSGDWPHPQVTVGDDQVTVAPGDTPETVEQEEVLRLFTGADGTVTAHVPQNRIIGVVAAKGGHTEEWIANLAAGSSGGGNVDLPLYRERVSVTIEDTWGPGSLAGGVVTGSNEDTAWQPHPVPFGNSTAANEGYAARIVSLEATITWSNDADAFGNLAVGLGPDPDDAPTYFEDPDDNLGAGPQEETVRLDVTDLRDHDLLGGPPIHAGAASDVGHFAPFGLEYILEITAEFDAAVGKLQSCIGDQTGDDDGFGVAVPGAPLALVVLSVGLTTWVVRRR